MTYNWGLSGSKTFRTLSTAIGESRFEYWETTLLLRELQQEGRTSGFASSEPVLVSRP